MSSPPTRYAHTGDASIAYQTLGDGPCDLVLVTGSASHMELLWDEPRTARTFRTMAGFARLILHDRRGTGLSDSDDSLPTLEQQVDDLRAVLAAVGSERTAIIDGSDLGLSALFAATYPDQVTGLVLSGVAADGQDTLGGSRELLLDAIERSWGDGTLVSLFAPSQVDNRDFVQWWGRMQRSAVTPGMARKLMDMQTNLRDVLPTIRVPTIVVHARGDRMVPLHRGREVAALIPGARFIERAGDDAYGWLDSRWRERLEDHDRIVRAALDRWRGREIKTSGDGFLATFDGPARGVRCAAEIVESVAALGLSVRTGLHTGECEMLDDDVAGIAVHIASRVMHEALSGEVLASSTVKDLVVGSSLRFTDRGDHALRGVSDPWRLYALER